LRRGAGRGHAHAQDHDALALANGRGTAQEAQNNFGFCLQDGAGGRVDAVNALKMFRNAADRGCREANVNAGMLLIHGPPEVRDPHTGVIALRAAAEAEDPAGQFAYAMCLIDGMFISQDIEEGQKYLVRAAAQGHSGAALQLWLRS
jgi:TPR repeat protein